MTRFGHIVTTNNDLAITCEQCGSTARHVAGQTLSEWRAAVRAFKKQHRECVK